MAKRKGYVHGKSPAPTSWGALADVLKSGKKSKAKKGESLLDRFNKLEQSLKENK